MDFTPGQIALLAIVAFLIFKANNNGGKRGKGKGGGGGGGGASA